MKKAIQKLTVGTRIAITKHSITKNSTQLRNDLSNGSLHVLGITQIAAKASAHFSRVDLFLMTKGMRKINQEPIEYLIKTPQYSLRELQISLQDKLDAAQGGHTPLKSTTLHQAFSTQ